MTAEVSVGLTLFCGSVHSLTMLLFFISPPLPLSCSNICFTLSALLSPTRSLSILHTNPSTPPLTMEHFACTLIHTRGPERERERDTPCRCCIYTSFGLFGFGPNCRFFSYYSSKARRSLSWLFCADPSAQDRTSPPTVQEDKQQHWLVVTQCCGQ